MPKNELSFLPTCKISIKWNNKMKKKNNMYIMI